MKYKPHPLKKFAAFAAATAIAFAAHTARATEITWSGDGADEKWSTAGNWIGGVAPGAAADDKSLFTNAASRVKLDGDVTEADLAVSGSCNALVYNDDPTVTNALTLTDLNMLQQSGATFEANGSVKVVSTGGNGYVKGTTLASGGAQITLHKADLGDNADQHFIARGKDSGLTLTELKFCSWSGANTGVTFEAYDGAWLDASKGSYTPYSPITLKSVNADLFANGLQITKTSATIDCRGGYIDIGALSSTASSGMAITISNGTVRLRSATTLANGKRYTTLNLYSGQIQQNANSAITLGNSNNKGYLTVNLFPTPDSSETAGLILARNSGSSCKITLAAGVKFVIDCSGLNGFVGTKKMMVMQQTYGSGASYSIPTSSYVTLKGENAALCSAAFTQEGQNLMLSISVGGVLEPLYDTLDATKVIGSRISKLGDNHDEVAYAFTSTAGTLNGRLPAYVRSVRYLVCGGGGAGGGSSASGTKGGGGGGAGGLLTNIVDLAQGGAFSVEVGAGGSASTVTATSGSDSRLSLPGLSEIVATGGGRGGYSSSKAGATGGSGGGGANGSGGSGTEGQGFAGGTGNATYGGGGGGAGGAGGTGSSACGTAGAGVSSDILGVGYEYASGGLGGKSSTVGTSATRYGCGGGGGGYQNKAGGSGYQGIVVVRFTEDATAIMPPIVKSKVYTGETQVADVPSNAGYTVTANEGGVNVGDYTVTLTLKAGYTWDDGSSEPTNLTFTITQAQNAWTVEPAVSKETWLTSDEPGVLTAGATKFGAVTATIAKDGGASEPFGGTLPTVAGDYVITYTAPAACDNYLAPEVAEKAVAFTIVDDGEVPPFTVAIDGAIQVGETEGVITAAVPYRVSCDVESPKTVTVYALYAEEGSATTNQIALAENVALDGAGFGLLNDLKPNATYAVALYGQGGTTVAPTSNWVTVTVPGAAKDLSASATFTNDPMEFILSGSVTPGLGTTTVYLRWSLNSGALDQSATWTFAYGDAGAFSTNIVYTDLYDTLTWDVAVSNDYTSATYGEQKWDDAIAASEKTRIDTSVVTYTWTGAGDDNSWANLANWSASQTPCFGYPDNVNYATAAFPKNSEVTVDLGGHAVDIRAITLPASCLLTITNGTVKTTDDHAGKFLLTDGHMTIKDGGEFDFTCSNWHSAIFNQNGYGAVLELAGNATYKGYLNTFTYDEPAATIGNAVRVHGENNLIDGVVKNRNGNLFLEVENGSLVCGDYLQAWETDHRLTTSVSNATVSCKGFSYYPATTPCCHAFEIFVPKAGLAAAPIEARYASTLNTNTLLTVTFDEEFSGKVPLLKGVSFADFDYSVTNKFSVLPAKLAGRTRFFMEGDTLKARVAAKGFVLFVR